MEDESIFFSHFLAGVGKIEIRYESPGNFNPESVRIDLDDGESESIASHLSCPDTDRKT